MNGIRNDTIYCSYKHNIQLRSALLREQPLPPMDLAVFWIEHVMKHKGAPHMQSAVVKLKWYQSYLIDVIAFLASLVVIFLYISMVILKKLYKFLRRKCGGFNEKPKSD